MRRFIVLSCMAFLLASGLPSASAQLAAANPWMGRGVLNMPHQGGEIEAPSDTLFALKTAIRKGGDMLELDVHANGDGEIMVLHDTTVNRTTNGTGRVDAMSTAQIKKFDAAHWFVPNCGTCHDKPAKAYAYRGYATGVRKIPKALVRQGFRPNDFTIPTLREVFKTFPNVPINIEIKNTAPDTDPYEQTLAELLDEFGRTDDVIVVSFLDNSTEVFKLYAPDVPTATGTVETALFRVSMSEVLPGLPNPRYVALQVPMVFEGITVVNKDFIDDAHANNLAVHVWTVNDAPTMHQLIEWGVDGIMTDRPTLLEQILRVHRVHLSHAR